MLGFWLSNERLPDDWHLELPFLFFLCGFLVLSSPWNSLLFMLFNHEVSGTPGEGAIHSVLPSPLFLLYGEAAGIHTVVLVEGLWPARKGQLKYRLCLLCDASHPALVPSSPGWPQELFVNVQESESESEVAQSCMTLCDPMDCSPPGSSIHGILQARVLEWVAISFSGGSSPPRDWNRVSRIVGRRFTAWATRVVQCPGAGGQTRKVTKKGWETGPGQSSPRFPSGSEVNNPPANAGDIGSTPGLVRSPRERNGNPLQYSCLGNPMDRGAWRSTVHGSQKSWTLLCD